MNIFSGLLSANKGFVYNSQIWFRRVCAAEAAKPEPIFNPKKTGGPKRPPLDILRDYSATRKALAATLHDFFLSSFPHILTPNL